MSVEENKALATRIIEEFINKKNPSVADEIFAEDFHNHSSPSGITPDREGLKQMIAWGWKTSPDFHLAIEDMVAENDKVVLSMRGTGTFTGEVLGVQVTNKSFSSFTITILRFEGGKAKERWNVVDNLDSLLQLGLDIKVFNKA